MERKHGGSAFVLLSIFWVIPDGPRRLTHYKSYCVLSCYRSGSALAWQSDKFIHSCWRPIRHQTVYCRITFWLDCKYFLLLCICFRNLINAILVRQDVQQGSGLERQRKTLFRCSKGCAWDWTTNASSVITTLCHNLANSNPFLTN